MFEKHSKGLILLFLTEMWERFGFYTMRALLVLYLVAEVADGGLGWSRHDAIALNGFYIGTTYMTPILGGYFSDRYLGQRRSAMIGAWLMAVGYFLLVFQLTPIFYSALTLVAIGNGFFKPCLTSILGQLYEDREESDRDSAYSIFYMGINIGGMAAGLAAGAALMVWGFYAGFLIAGAGMMVGVAIFWWGKGRYLEDKGLQPTFEERNEVKKPLTSLEYKRIAVILFLFAVTIVFFASWEQMSGLITLFIQNSVDRKVGGWEIPTPWLANIDPGMIVVMAPVLSALWTWLGTRHLDPYIGNKMGIGCFCMALSFLVLSLMIHYEHYHWSLILIEKFLVVLGELCVIPISWAAVTRLAPKAYMSRLMGLMLAGIGLGSYLAGWIGSWVDVVGEQTLFNSLIVTSGMMGLLCFAVNPILKKLDAPCMKKRII